MPYTPPSQNSPASSKSTSPSVSRSSSYCEDGPLSPVTGRPQLPRSMSSASYLNRHRRSPSISSQHAEFQSPPTPVEYSSQGIAATDFAPSASLRQSPPPVNNLIIPTGAIMSPPDSSENSDGEESSQDSGRGRALEIRMLQDAVRVIPVKREPSPNSSYTAHKTSTSEPTSQTVSPSALSAAARKISHGRSHTETSIVIPRSASFPAESPAHTSDDSDDDYLHSKPALVRKKSGELVKPALRPSSRRRYSSMPGTPTYSKSVHFNDNDNQTRHFLQVDKPIAVSAGSSPVEVYDSEAEYPFDDKKEKNQREIKLTNFPEDTFERKTQPVRVERIFLSSDKQTLVGTCAVQNISFHKLVVARFTLDYWKTTSEVVAEYHNDPRSPNADGCDRFNFHIKLSDAANIDDKTLLLCVRYAVDGQEFWDNNKDMNYQIDFIKAEPRKVARIRVPVRNDTRPHNNVPRSRHSPSHGRGRQGHLDDDFTGDFSSTSYHFGTPDTFVGEQPSTIKLKPKTKSQHASQQAGTSGNLGGRYDFGASLSAALTHAQEKLGRQSGLLGPAEPKTGGSYFGPQERKDGPTASNNDKPNLGSDRPAMGSDQYRDLVQKFCYFTSSGSTRGVSSPNATVAPSTKAPAVKAVEPQTDGSIEAAAGEILASRSSSSCSTPASLDGTYELPISPAVSQLISRSASPAKLAAQNLIDTAHSVPFYTQDSYFSETSPHRTAISG